MGGQTSTTESEPPEWFSDAAKKSLAVADQINQAGYVPYMGNEIAAFTPQQKQAMQSASDWSSAMDGKPRKDAMRGMPQAQRDASGVMGYGSYNGLMANLEQLKERSPSQYAQLTRFGGDLLASPGTIPGNITDSPWSMTPYTPPSGGGMPEELSPEEKWRKEWEELQMNKR